MNKNQKKLRLSRGLTLSLALLLAVTVIVTAIAFTAARKSKAKNSETTTTDNQTTAQTTTTTTTTQKSETPVSADPSDFSSPVPAGYLIKSHSSDVPVYSITMEDYRVHNGIDIGAKAGSDVLATLDGVVSRIYSDPMMGQSIEITHSESLKTVYKCLGTKLPDNIEEGAQVKKGDVIGYVGETALIEISDAPHVHFEIISDNAQLDPLSCFDVAKTDGTETYEG